MTGTKLALALAGVISGSAAADVMVLKNGERLVGELQSIRNDAIVWKSDSFSTVTVSKSDVESLVLTREVKINGHEDPCYMDSFDSGTMIMTCEGEEMRVHLDMLYSLEPWVPPDQRYFKYSGYIRLFGELFWGNRTDRDWLLDTGISVAHADFQHRARAYYKQDDSTDDTVELNIKASLNYDLDWFYNEHWYLNGNAEYLRDDNSFIVSRNTVGLGVGYRFWDDNSGHLTIENGPAYVVETKDDTGMDITSESVGWRYNLDWSAPLAYWPWQNTPDFYHRHTLTATDKEDLHTTFETNTGISFPLVGGIGMTIDLEADYDSKPSTGLDEMDYKLALGLNYAW